MIAFGKLPSEHYLLVAHVMLGRYLTERVEQVLIIRVAIPAERAPAYERQAGFGAVVQRILRLQVNRGILKA